MALPPLPDRETLRLHQANERTLLAWVRTALATMGFGFVVARFGLLLRELGASRADEIARGDAPWSLWTGVALASVGVVMVLASLVRFRMTTRAIERHEVGLPAGEGWIYVVGSIVGLVGIAIVAILLAPLR